MIFATIEYEGGQQICCVDQVGKRAFLIEPFFRQDLSELAIDSNQVKKIPLTMNEFIEGYCDGWIDDLALFFGSHPEMGISLDEVRLLAPIPELKRNITCLGKNYAAHAEEIHGMTGGPSEIPTHPIYFTKAIHTVIGTKEEILSHENITKKLDYEAELAVVIGRKGIDIPKEKAEEYIFGYAVANDVSARDLQTGHVQWFKGKSLTTHCPIGPWIVHKSVLPLPLTLDIKCYVNEELRQSANTGELIFDVPSIISDLSRGYELRPGDIILTGTPAGVGMGFDPPRFLKSGDEVCCMIEGVGSIVNKVK
ncbi:fumarylacetoacetate hydrolase family protein [Sinanaerobacter chloroacetimidivorans]|nr:fumarylacetoacetate hydrolase family protein [Sinanaerobacter chloroacetimidivorans]